MKVHADLDRCMGNGMCEATAPRYFRVDDDGLVVAPAGEIPADDQKLVRDAVAACPTRTLTILDDTD